MTTFIIGFTIWLGLASVALVFNYAIHNVNPRDDDTYPRTTMTKPNKEHWEDLYRRLHDAYVECITHNNVQYETKLARLLDDMIAYNKLVKIR